ncbi:complement component 1 Q subcomponent-binding protein, mitochondrial [Daktulosphaira vitifoliae]|uniref:complement component 1 Q subcomponent-binding protein, mitochondrial n=1 Tax=Daktulosphaira vitifoliae TaxID=58002 RepID=UPI0021AAF9CD|nr:complement component 1 Q subcomponent-binding protein, mitochondrial [Daktulosphaira vitifoliae]
MNNLIRSLSRTSRLSNVIYNNISRKISTTPISQSLWSITNRFVPVKHFNIRSAHSTVEKELHKFLEEEIKAEEKTSDKTVLPKTLEGFKINFDAAEVEFVKENMNETISIKFNINHSVTEEEIEGSEKVLLKSKPDFEIDITRGDTTLGFNCSFSNDFEGTEVEEANDDIFRIDELTIYENKYSESKYALSGETLDADLYDLLMSFLADKGVTSEFVEKLSEISTKYEQSVYIQFLNDLKKFF